MSGSTLIELMVICFLLLAVTAIGAAGLSRVGGDTAVAVCAERTSDYFQNANARALSGKLESRIAVGIETGTLKGNWAEPAFELPTSCSFRSASFGVSGKSKQEAVFYPTGAASPGNILIQNQKADWCRLTQSLRGARTVRCFK